MGVTVRAGLTGPVLDIDGSDAELLQAQTGELLEALQHLVNQVFGRSLEGSERLVCDVRGFRATREAELAGDGEPRSEARASDRRRFYI